MLLIAHRSGPDTYPEQTIQSGREALSFGADLIEIDVRPTADNQAAMSHDPDAKRIFGVDKKISDMTAAEFKMLRHLKDPAFSSHMIADVFAAGLKPLLIHVKDKRALPALLKVIDEYDYAGNVTIGVADVGSVTHIRNHNPAIKILSFSATVEQIPAMVEAGVDYVRLWEKWLTPENVQMVRDLGAKLWVMSGVIRVNTGYPTEEDLEKILAYKPDGLLINEIRFAKKIISRM